MVTKQQIQLGVSAFVENEIAIKSSGFNKFATYFMLPTIQTKTADLITKLSQNELFSVYFNEKGDVDLDKVYQNAKESIKKSGQFEIFGIIFNESDIDKLYTTIQRSQL